MNRKRKSKSKSRIALLAGFVTAAVILSVAYVSAGSALLTPGMSTTVAGSAFGFTLDLSSLDIDESADDNQNQFIVTLTVDPSDPAIEVEEGVGDLKGNGEYHVTSAQLDGLTSLQFWVTPPSDLAEETTYTVSVDVVGSAEGSDSFSFVAVPLPSTDDGSDASESDETTEESASGQSSTGQSGGQGQGQQTGGNAAGSQMPGGSGSAMPNMKNSTKAKGSMSGSAGASYGSSGASSTVTYEGSWDNYLESLSVSDYAFTQTFNKTRDTYFLTVPEEVESLEVEAEPCDSAASVSITGTEELPLGRSKIMINVTAENGSVRVYRIYVDRVSAEEYANGTDEDAQDLMPPMNGQGMPENMPAMDGSMPENLPAMNGNVSGAGSGEATEDSYD